MAKNDPLSHVPHQGGKHGPSKTEIKKTPYEQRVDMTARDDDLGQDKLMDNVSEKRKVKNTPKELKTVREDHELPPEINPHVKRALASSSMHTLKQTLEYALMKQRPSATVDPENPTKRWLGGYPANELKHDFSVNTPDPSKAWDY